MTGGLDQIKEDMKLIGDLVIRKMETIYHPHFDREASTATTAVLSGIKLLKSHCIQMSIHIDYAITISYKVIHFYDHNKYSLIYHY